MPMRCSANCAVADAGRGAAAVGYKIGLTTRRMQEMCGIDSPIAGVVLADRVYASGACLSVQHTGGSASSSRLRYGLAAIFR